MNKTALITGVSGGIGRAAAKAFINAGWTVAGIDIQDMSKPVDKIHFIKGDVSVEDSAEKIFNKAGKILGRLDVLVNNAAVQICKPVIDMKTDEWDSVIGSNLNSIYLALRYSYRFLRKPGGSIVNVGSVHALATSKNISAYAASKGGALSFTRALAVELADDGIRVNMVLPGSVDTNMLRTGLKRGHIKGSGHDDMLTELGRRTPLGRIGKPEEIAQSILFLADNDRSSFITGEAIVVDGGALARLSTE